MTRLINDAGMALLEEFEQGPDGGPALTPYRCPAGRWTNGYGNTHGVTEDTAPITSAQASADLCRNATGAAHAVEAMTRCPLNDNQFAALACLVFNIGPTNFLGSTLHRILNDGRAAGLSGVPAEFAKWDKAHVDGQLVELGGLKRRRAAEIALWRAP